MVAFLRARVRNPEVAFDLAAETFAAVVVSAARYQPGGAPAAAWLLGIARHKLLESLRRGRVEDGATRICASRRSRCRTRTCHWWNSARATAQAALHALLAELPSDQRTALLAHVVDERAYVDIAAELGCSEQVVRQRVSRGLRRLRERLERRPVNAFDKLEHELRAGVRRGAAAAPEPARPWRQRPRGLAIALIALVVCGSAAAAVVSARPRAFPNRSQHPPPRWVARATASNCTPT